jgi:hypothetical protein
MKNDDIAIILAAIALLGAITICGFQTVIERCRPRIIYVYSRLKETDAEEDARDEHRHEHRA